NARAGRKKRPELRDFIKRFPKLRGRGVNSNKSIQDNAIVVNLSAIDAAFAAGEAVTVETLLAKRVIDANRGKKPIVKVLGAGDISKKIIVSGLVVSATAKAKIEKAGGE